MKEFVHLRRYNERLMELFVIMSRLQEKVGEYSILPTPQALDELQKYAEHVESRYESMKASLASLVREVESNGEDDTVDAEETPDGYRM